MDLWDYFGLYLKYSKKRLVHDNNKVNITFDEWIRYNEWFVHGLE